MMKSSTYFNWFRRLLILGALVAGATASTAAAVANPEGGSSIAVQHTTPLGLKADGMRLQGIAQVYGSLSTDALPTAQGLKADGLRWQGIAQTYEQPESAGNFPTQLGLKAEGMRLQAMARMYRQIQPVPDVVERFAAVHQDGAGVTSTAASVSRPPDVSDAALAVQYGSGSVGQSSTAFDWGDWAIGIGSGLGLALLLGAGFLMNRQLNHRVQTA
jgi:hypothetical protein